MESVVNLLDWKPWTEVLAQIAACLTMIVVSVSALYAYRTLRITRSQRKAQVLGEFWTNLYRDEDARAAFIKISNEQALNLSNKKEMAGVAHLLDALNTIGVMAQDDKAVRDLANLTSIAYVAVKAHDNHHVQEYIGALQAEHVLMQLGDKVFSEFQALAEYLKSEKAKALRLRTDGELVKRKPHLLHPE
jgi:hypothetical protein